MKFLNRIYLYINLLVECWLCCVSLYIVPICQWIDALALTNPRHRPHCCKVATFLVNYNLYWPSTVDRLTFTVPGVTAVWEKMETSHSVTGSSCFNYFMRRKLKKSLKSQLNSNAIQLCNTNHRVAVEKRAAPREMARFTAFSAYPGRAKHQLSAHSI